MGRRQISAKNTIIALISEVIVTLVGLLLPRAIILNYGSETNGLITSLQQFIQYFTLLEAGLSGAAVFSLFKPLAEHNENKIRQILYSAKLLYKKMGTVYVCILAIFSLIYPILIAKTGYSYWEIIFLFWMIGLNGATQLLFIGKYKVLLNASQNNRVIAFINATTTCMYSVIIIVCAYSKVPAMIAVFMAVSAYIVRSVAYYISVKNLFPEYSYEKVEKKYVFPNQKEVFIQQILSLLILNSGTLILSFTKTSMEIISLYNIYNMVLTAIFLISNSVNTGVSASFGDLIARNDGNRLKKVYCEYEVLFQIFWVVLFSCVSVLYKPFMQIYTQDFTDMEYVRPALCILFSLLGASWVIRNQQSVIIVAAGKFKEIQKRSFIETILTMICSCIGLQIWGLEGLLIGRIIGAVYRAIDFIVFCSKNVIKTQVIFTMRQIGVSVLAILIINYISNCFLGNYITDSWITWIAMAICCVLCSTVIAIIMQLLVETRITMQWVKKVFNKITGR